LAFAAGVIYTISEGNISTTTSLAQGAAAVLGVASTIMTGFVGSILLRMYQESASTLKSFHHALNQTGTILFANVLSAALDDVERKRVIKSMITSLTRAAVRPPETTSEPSGGGEPPAE
jgi:hypothetical protein